MKKIFLLQRIGPCEGKGIDIRSHWTKDEELRTSTLHPVVEQYFSIFYTLK